MKSEILGVKIDNLTMARTLRKIEGFLTDGRQHYIVTPNPEFLVLARKDEDFRRILNQADLAVPDGIGLVFASWFLGQPLKQRIAGTDLMEKICQRAALRGWPVFLLGDREDGLVEETAERLKKKYPDLKIEGSSFSDPLASGAALLLLKDALLISFLLLWGRLIRKNGLSKIWPKYLRSN